MANIAHSNNIATGYNMIVITSLGYVTIIRIIIYNTNNMIVITSRARLRARSSFGPLEDNSVCTTTTTHSH